MPRGDKCWVVWAEKIRIHMMTNKLEELTVATVDIHADTGTHETLANLQSQGF
jgi:hypothetical protein